MPLKFTCTPTTHHVIGIVSTLLPTSTFKTAKLAKTFPAVACSPIIHEPGLRVRMRFYSRSDKMPPKQANGHSITWVCRRPSRVLFVRRGGTCRCVSWLSAQPFTERVVTRRDSILLLIHPRHNRRIINALGMCSTDTGAISGAVPKRKCSHARLETEPRRASFIPQIQQFATDRR
jgi:hypothetical protein